MYNQRTLVYIEDNNKAVFLLMKTPIQLFLKYDLCFPRNTCCPLNFIDYVSERYLIQYISHT